MDTLVNRIVEKTGVSEEVARQIVEIVMNYFEENLPKPLVKQLKPALSNEETVNRLGDAAKGLFGKKAE